MQVVYNKDCSTYNIHMLYSMMIIKNKQYRLRKLGYVPILKCMEYVSNSDFMRRFDEETKEPINMYDWGKNNALYKEKIYIDCFTISGINVKFVEPDDIFERIIAKITWYNLFKIIEMTVDLGYLRCFRHMMQYYKIHYNEPEWNYLTRPPILGSRGGPFVPDSFCRLCKTYKSLFFEDLVIWLHGKPEFYLIYREYFP